MKRRIVLTAFLLVLGGCQQAPPNNPPPTSGNLTLALFAAPWCQNCPKELAELDRRFKSFSKSSKVTTVVYITSGNHPFEPPTQDIANQYKTKLGVSFNFTIDPWRLTNYSRYIEADGQDLPAAAILDEKGNAVKVLAPGQYTPVDVVNELQTRLK